MQKEFKNLFKLGIAFLAILVFFSLTRLYFYLNNLTVFLALPDFNLSDAFVYGFIYDVKFVLAVNSIIILMFFLPIRLRNTIFWQFIVKLSFTLLNGALILLYLVDSKYYGVTDKHLELHYNQDVSLKEQFIALSNIIDLKLNHSWDIVLIVIPVIAISWIVFPSINKMYFERSKSNLIFRFAITFFAAFLVWYTVNQVNDKSGDWQEGVFRQMNSSTAGVAINSPCYMLRFYYSDELQNKNYFDKDELKATHPVNKNYFSRTKNRQNLIIINTADSSIDIPKLELAIKSLSARYYKSSYFFSANQGISLQMDEQLMSVPAFGKLPLMKTSYAFNKFQSLAKILKQNGYYTILATNSPDKELYKAFKNFYGFDKLTIRKQNHKLFSNFEQDIKKTKEDYYFVYFQINSGLNELLTYIIDNGLKDNTFIMINLQKTIIDSDFQAGKTFYLMPDTIKDYYVASHTQNLDILPSVVDYLDLNEKFIAFGTSVFYKTEKRYVFLHTAKDYVILEDSLLLRYNGQTSKWLIDYKNDPDEFFDLQDSLPVKKVEFENKIRAVIQEKNYRLINNNMVPTL